jgi:hypothetical protein
MKAKNIIITLIAAIMLIVGATSYVVCKEDGDDPSARPVPTQELPTPR